MQLYFTRFMTALCEIILVGNQDGLTNLVMITGKTGSENVVSDLWVRSDDLFTSAIQQITEYFEGSRKDFDLKLNPHGTEFQKRVWNELQTVPFGKTISYKELAQRIGNPSAVRAVGMANSKNPLPLIVPCHRVIGADGGLTGYAYGLELKENLLRMEGALKTAPKLPFD